MSVAAPSLVELDRLQPGNERGGLAELEDVGILPRFAVPLPVKRGEGLEKEAAARSEPFVDSSEKGPMKVAEGGDEAP